MSTAATKQSTHALVPLDLWQQLVAYVRTAPTGAVPFEQVAQLMGAMQRVQGCVHEAPEVSEIVGE